MFTTDPDPQSSMRYRALMRNTQPPNGQKVTRYFAEVECSACEGAGQPRGRDGDACNECHGLGYSMVQVHPLSRKEGFELIEDPGDDEYDFFQKRVALENLFRFVAILDGPPPPGAPE